MDDWTIAGIIHGFPHISREVYLNGEKTELLVDQHTGIVVYTPMEKVQELIKQARN